MDAEETEKGPRLLEEVGPFCRCSRFGLQPPGAAEKQIEVASAVACFIMHSVCMRRLSARASKEAIACLSSLTGRSFTHCAFCAAVCRAQVNLRPTARPLVHGVFDLEQKII